MDRATTFRPHDIAIVGMACRFPDADNYDQFWQNLSQGLCSVREVPASRWDKEAFYSADGRDKNRSVSKWGGFLNGVEYFDAEFFGVSAREAAVMDPQQRIMLELAWSCIEDAGYDASSLGGTRTGVYIGVFNFDYADHWRKALDAIEGHVATGMHTALIPNRISHFFDLRGPSLPIDTACSSSLVALHEAAHAIARGECEQALVGAVSVLCSPTHFVSFSKTGMLSPDGRCKSFDVQANGYVRGEGAAFILLKPLDQAVRDNDRIAAVIRGTAINHGGRARTVTHPGSMAQSEVIAAALMQSNVPVDTISYVEAHGTGTPKGDPIEIEGLQSAFRRVAHSRGEILGERTCGIGSVKTNIGHLESVAGLAGLIKTILCMKHQRLPELLHFRQLNPRIQLAGSPFYIVDEARPWHAVLDGAGRPLPRRAGISSFGFGGVNSHVVVEEYVGVGEQQAAEPVTSRALIVLSAKTMPALRERVLHLLEEGVSSSIRRAGLADLAFTLQIGRQAMPERLALVVDSFEHLHGSLRAWLDQKVQPSEVFSGRVNATISASIPTAAEPGAPIESLLTGRNLTQLAVLWVKGHELNWTVMHGTQAHRRLALPTYPFAREKHWIAARAAEMVSTETAMHPLLHRNTSNLSGLRFSARFGGEEFFLSDHLVQGRRTLPGVAQLEMARCAGSQTLPSASAIRLTDVVWLRPVRVEDEPLEVHVALFQKEGDEIAFELYGGADNRDAVVYSEGNITTCIIGEYAAGVHDISALRGQCTSRFTAAQCYASFEKLGLSYGPGHRGLDELFVGNEQALGRIVLPLAVQDSLRSYVLHPSLLDAALQTAIGMQTVAAGSGKAALLLPFALGALDIRAPCAGKMWAVVRRRSGGAADDSVQKFDIDICDEVGTVCIRFTDLSTRAMAPMAVEHSVRTALLRPEWKVESARPASVAPAFARHVVLLCGGTQDVSPDATRVPGVECLTLDRDEDLARGFESAACFLLEKIQMLAGVPGQHLIQVIVPEGSAGQVWAGLGGMLRCAQLENPRIVGQVIGVESGQDILRAIAEDRGDGARVRYRNGTRWVAVWEELQVDLNSQSIPVSHWKDSGVYLITGGAGGLGQIFARHIATCARKVNLILTGRSLVNEAIFEKVRVLEALGAVVQYRQVDVSERDAVMQLVQSVHKELKGLDGIIHCAGTLRDSFIVRKTAPDLREVFGAKVAGTVNLDLASRDIALDCFLCFASTSGALGNVGQADYAAANSFMDAYAYHRTELVAQGQRHGRTLAIDWPLWEEGGMEVEAGLRQDMTQRTGLIPLRTASGLSALENALSSGLAQVLVAEGDIGRFRTGLTSSTKLTPETDKGPSTAPGVSVELREKARRYFVRLLSSTLKRPAHSIDAHAPMEGYGIDSILVMELTRVLEQVFGSLSKTLFFEYRTIAALAEYFLQTHRSGLMALLGEKSFAADSAPTADIETVAPPRIARRPRFGVVGQWETDAIRQAAPAAARGMAGQVGDIAIIGVAGRYPQASNLEEFWDNLRAGRDCVTEIPPGRWDYQLYYDPDRSKAGKTYSKWGGFIDGVDLFDPLFFNISPREAELMDPQERLFLECVYATLEDAGYTRETVAQCPDSDAEGSVGVYVGVMYEEYQLYAVQEQVRGRNLAIFDSPASIANRISYFCNFNGPSMAVDTMCSSSLTAIHLACQSLLRGECIVAIAGGVNVSIHPNKYLVLAQGKFISGKGRCESFGEGGEGYVPGEGVGAILLKPEARAVADGDHIYGVIKASAVNHGGKTNGYTVPNPHAQAKVVERAMHEGGIDARAVSYIEAHGTGTTLGDPIEIAGLSRAFTKWTQDKQFCAIGSAKSNIGHCESAAGIAGVTKVLLQLKHQQLVPSLHSASLNQNIDFANSPFIVQQELSSWRRPRLEIKGVMREVPRIAGVSSFGAGGANAHLVIQEHIESAAPARQLSGPALVVLSARDEQRLQERVRRLLQAITPSTDIALADLAYTLQVGRESMEERLAFMVHSLDELRQKLRLIACGTDTKGVFRGHVKRNLEALDVLAADDDMLRTVESWVEQGKYERLLSMWVKGLGFDWRKLYGPTRPRRVSLPTYPFARERYWIQPVAAPRPVQTTQDAQLHR